MSKRDEAMRMLDQMQDMLIALEKSGEDRQMTKRTYLVLARVVYWLLERWIREHDDEGRCNQRVP